MVAANTPDIPSGNEDLGAEASEHVQGQVRSTQTDTLVRLGLLPAALPGLSERNLSAARSVRIAGQIIGNIRRRIASFGGGASIDAFGIDVGEMQQRLEQSVRSSLEETEGAGGPYEHSQRLKAIADAVAASLPSEILHALVVGTIPASLQDQYKDLRDSSENHMGAAMAAEMLQVDSTLEDKLKGDTTKFKKEIRQKKKLRLIAHNLDVFHKCSLPSAKDSLLEINSKIGDISGFIASLPTVAKIGSLGHEEEWTIGPSVKDQEAARQLLINRKKELEKEKAQLIEVNKAVLALHLAAEDAGRHIPMEFDDILDDSVPAAREDYDPSTVNIEELFIKAQNALGVLAADKYIEQIRALEEKRDKAKKESLKGDAAQQAVVQEYFIRHRNMNKPDAQRATNYLLGRSLLDAEMAASAETVANELYGKNPRPEFVGTNIREGLMGREETIVADVAAGCGLNVKRGNILWGDVFGLRERGVKVRWADETPGGYRKLMAAYFTLRKLVRDGGPDGMRLKETKFVQTQMRAISEIILQKHLPAMLKDFGPQLTDEQKKELLQVPQKQEHRAFLKNLLDGAPPTSVEPLIERATNFAHERWKRFSWRFGGVFGLASDREYGLLGGRKYGFVVGSNNPFSVKNLLYGNPRASLKNLQWDMPKAGLKMGWRGAKSAGGAIKNKAEAILEPRNMGRIAKWGLLGLFGGPVVAGIAVAAAVASSKKGGG